MGQMPGRLPVVTAPLCISNLIADEVYRDAETNKHIIAGAFNSVGAERVPAPARFAVFVSITDANATNELAFVIEHEETGHTVIELRGPYREKDPLKVHDVVLRFQDLVFPAYGKYWVQVKSEGKILGQRPLYVRKMELTEVDGDDRD